MELKDKDITGVIVAGREKFASVPSGGAAIAMGAPVAGAGGAAPAEEEKKEERVEEKEESDDVSVFQLSNCSLFIHPMLLFWQDSYLANSTY
jgi:large subunit ribosomal protein LP2